MDEQGQEDFLHESFLSSQVFHFVSLVLFFFPFCSTKFPSELHEVFVSPFLQSVCIHPLITSTFHVLPVCMICCCSVLGSVWE